ncbi:MAG: hypothetical protein R3D59_03075 [Paracoccaceae bacterium]
MIRFSEPARHRFRLPALDDPRQLHEPGQLIVIPGGKMDLAMQLIFTPMIDRLVSTSKRA